MRRRQASPRRGRTTIELVVAARPSLRGSRKQRAAPANELLCEYVFRPLAHLVVLALLPLRVPPPAVVLAAAATGFAAALELWREDWIAAAVLLQVKTVLDNADGQLARAAGKESVLGRYLDSESDLLVNVALFAALAHVTGRPWLAVVAFLALTLVLSVDFNLERLYRREAGDVQQARPAASGLAGVLARVYDVVYAPQDRLVEGFVEWRLRRVKASPAGRLAYHDHATLAVLANFGLSTQLAVLGLCLVLVTPTAYLWIAIACCLALVPLELRRERRARVA
jgi:phosphatidylglycerophosphate synthase